MEARKRAKSVRLPSFTRKDKIKVTCDSCDKDNCTGDEQCSSSTKKESKLVRLEHTINKNCPKSLPTTGSVKEFLFNNLKDTTEDVTENQHDTLEKIQQQVQKPDSCDEIPETPRTSEKKFYRRFDLPGERLIDGFICALILKGTLLAQGTLYITQNYVCFYSNILRKKITFFIKFEDIICIRKCMLFKSIPNSIEIHTAEKKYSLSSLFNRKEAFQLMDSRWRIIRKKLGMPIIEYLDTDDVEGLDFQINEGEVKSEVFFSEICSHESTKVRDIPPRYTEIFPMSVEEFFFRFISNLSIPFWVEFMSKDGDEMTSCSSWENSEGGCCREREIEFTTPIRIIFSPTSSTRVVQKQRYRFVNENEMIFETHSYSIDVPFSQQFLVDSYWHIKEYQDKEHCELNISIGVSFTKKLHFKWLIEQAAIEGSRVWFMHWIHFARTVAVQNDKNRDLEDTPKELQDQDNAQTSEIISEKSKETVVTAHGNIRVKSFPVVFFLCFSMMGNKLLNIGLMLLLFLVFLLFGTALYYYILSSSLHSHVEDIKLRSISLQDQYKQLDELLVAISHRLPYVPHILSNFQSHCLLNGLKIFEHPPNDFRSPEELLEHFLLKMEECLSATTQPNYGS